MAIHAWHCPRCSRELEAEGLASMEGVELTVFQCDHCTVTVPLFPDDPNDNGEVWELPFTFAVDPAGQVFSRNDKPSTDPSPE